MSFKVKNRTRTHLTIDGKGVPSGESVILSDAKYASLKNTDLAELLRKGAIGITEAPEAPNLSPSKAESIQPEFSEAGQEKIDQEEELTNGESV